MEHTADKNAPDLRFDRPALKKAGLRLWSLFRGILLLGLAFMILRPFITKILMASMSPADLLDSSVVLVPKTLSAEYWQAAWDGLNPALTALPSFVLAAAVGVLQLASSALVGYGLARVRFRGRAVFFLFVFLIMLVPQSTYASAQYLRFAAAGLGLTNSAVPLLLMSAGGLGLKQGLYIYLFYSFFLALPKELEDAASIDGLGSFGTFLRVILPNAKNILLTVFLFSFCWQWTDISYARLYFTESRMLASQIPAILLRIGSTFDILGTGIARNAACLFVMIPLVLIFIFAQKMLRQSISTSGQAN